MTYSPRHYHRKEFYTSWRLLSTFALHRNVNERRLPHFIRILLRETRGERVKHDLAWFNSFLPHYNGVTYYDQSYCHSEVHLDACLTGLGGAHGNMVYALPIPKGYLHYNIAHLEILNIIVALKVWATHWANRRIRIHCDNMAVVEVLNSGRARDPTLALIARNIWLICEFFIYR